MSLSLFAVENVQLFVQSPIVIDVADQEQTSGEEVKDARKPLAHVKSVYSQDTEESEQDPGHIVIISPRSELDVSLAIHGGNKKEIYDPADEQQTKGEKIDGSGHGFSVIKPVRARETEDPKNVADRLAVTVAFEISHLQSSQ
jgi:hypothetical protein